MTLKRRIRFGRGSSPERPILSGLEVLDSTFAEWLAAGGERRRWPRADWAPPESPSEGGAEEARTHNEPLPG